MEMGSIPLSLTVILGQAKLPDEQYRALQKGDVILLNEELEAPLRLSLQGQKRLQGRPGKIGRKKAVVIL